MYKLANSSRKAMQEKAKRLASADPHQKVDSSTWTPAEPLDTEAKTGARPLVRRIYRSGGKVEGMAAKKRADRAARKSGGRTAPWVDDLINRDVRTANEAREGKKHVGAFKKGGRAGHANGKKVEDPYKDTGRPLSPEQKAMAESGVDPMEDRPKVRVAPRPAASTRRPVPMPVPRPAMLKKGGKVSHMEWEHSKADLKQDKKLAKKHGMSMEAWEKSDLDKKHDKQQSAKGLCYGGKAKKNKGGSVFSGNSTTKIPGVVGGRDARKRGGKTKGKTNISINIMPQAGGAPMPPMGMKPLMPPIAPPMAPPVGAPQMGGAPTDPALLAALAGGMKGGPAPMPAPMPMPRKSGGRTIHVINHASGGGLGRLEKIKAYGEAQKKLS